MLKQFACVAMLVLLIPQVSAVNKIVVVGLFKDKAVVRLDGVQRILIAGEISPEGVVLISANSKEAIMEINGIRNSYTVGTHIGSEFKGPTGKKSVTVAPDDQGMYWVNGSINDFQVKFIVDTGATLISMNKHQAKRLGLNYKLDGKAAIFNTASGQDTAYIMKLKKVKVGDIELRDIQGVVHDGDFPKTILLGNSFLSRINMVRKGRLLELMSFN